MYIVRETQGDSEVLDLTQLELAFTTIIYAPQINEYGQQEWVEYQRLQSPEENRIWRSLNEISPHLQHAFIGRKLLYAHRLQPKAYCAGGAERGVP